MTVSGAKCPDPVVAVQYFSLGCLRKFASPLCANSRCSCPSQIMANLIIYRRELWSDAHVLSSVLYFKFGRATKTPLTNIDQGNVAQKPRSGRCGGSKSSENDQNSQGITQKSQRNQPKVPRKQPNPREIPTNVKHWCSAQTWSTADWFPLYSAEAHSLHVASCDSRGRRIIGEWYI